MIRRQAPSPTNTNASGMVFADASAQLGSPNPSNHQLLQTTAANGSTPPQFGRNSPLGGGGSRSGSPLGGSSGGMMGGMLGGMTGAGDMGFPSMNPAAAMAAPQRSGPGRGPAALHRLPEDIPAQILKDYSAAGLEGADDLLQLYIPGASLVTEGVLRQCSDAELVLILGTMRQLRDTANTSLKNLCTERDGIRTQVAQRREWAENTYQAMA